ncbi:hypothetical protein FF1_039358 [Malus domestica]
MVENCFILDRTAESSGLSSAIVSSMIHGWQNTSWAVILFLGFLSSILPSRSRALLEILGHGSDSKSNLPCKICRKIPISVLCPERQNLT